MNKSTILLLMVVFVLLVVEIGQAQSLGTVFTYQGRLNDGGEPVNGPYDLEFKIFDAKILGSQIGETIIKQGVGVYGGYFTVSLDFGSGAFNGDKRWLELGVRPGDSSETFTTLDPRQQVTATPYALQTKGIYVSDANNVGIGTISPSAKLDVLSRTNIAIYGKNQTYNNYGYLGSSEFGVSGRVGAGYGAGVYGHSANPTSVGVHGYGGFGNYGYLGTSDYGVYGRHYNSGNEGHIASDSYGVYGFSSSGYAGYFEGKGYFSGDIGIGTTSPGAKLDVRDTSGAVGIYSESNSGWAIQANSHTSSGISIAALSNGGDAVRAEANGVGMAKLCSTAENAAGYFSGDVFMMSGKVGIGTTSPSEELEVSGDVTLSKNSGALILRTPTHNDPARYSIRFQNNYIAPILGDETQDQYFSFFTDFVKARNYSAHLRVHGQAANSWGTYMEFTHDGTDGIIETDIGDIVFQPAGNVGIGTSDPQCELEVNGQVMADSFQGEGSQLTYTGYNPKQIALLQWYDAIQTGDTTFSVGNGPGNIAFDGIYLWIVNVLDDTVSKLLPSDGSVVSTYPVGEQPEGVAYDGAHIWISNSQDHTVIKLRPSDGSIVGTYSIGGGVLPDDIVFDGTYIWTGNSNNTVTKLRASDGGVVGTYPAGGSSGVSRDLAFDGTHIWVTNPADDTVTKIRTSDGGLVSTYSVGDQPNDVAFDGSCIWVSNYADDTITRLRASDGSLVNTYPVGDGPSAVAFDGIYLWICNSNDDTVTKLRASDGSLVGTYSVGDGPVNMAFDGANIWVTNYWDDTVTKL